MDKITVIFTTREWNPVSWLIRWCLPRSRFANALASHSMIIDGDYAIEANMLYGVRRVPISEAMRGCVEVARRDYEVPDAESGLRWARQQVCTYTPPDLLWIPHPIRKLVQSAFILFYSNYDWRAAIGLAVSPGRNWRDPSRWECFEFIAETLAKSGRIIFIDSGHITGSILMSIKP